MTIKEKVKHAEADLKVLTSHTELRNWAISHDMDNRSAFPKFKAALIEIGIDYETMRGGQHAATEAELQAKITKRLTLYTDAKCSAGRFGICVEDGEVAWHGRFFDEDDAGEQSRAELCAAKKAVWFASKVKEACGQEAIELVLITDAQWLTYQDHGGQKGFVLTQMARKYGISLKVEWISGKSNPADKWTVSSGYKKWSENDLNKMLADI